MAGTFSQIYIQAVFAVKYRQSLILPSWEDALFKYITGIVQKKEQKMLAINGMPDHIHFLFRMAPTCCISDLVREVKKSSNKFTPIKFQWQGGFGAFSYCNSDVYKVINYIMNQKQHHQKVTFKNEYLGLLKEFGIEFKEEYLFNWFE